MQSFLSITIQMMWLPTCTYMHFQTYGCWTNLSLSCICVDSAFFMFLDAITAGSYYGPESMNTFSLSFAFCLLFSGSITFKKFYHH